MESFQEWTINTSNKDKLKEFQRLFGKHGIGLKSTKFDLDEVEADPITVIVHKASQLQELILVEDTSLDIEGADVGINVRWLIDHLEVYSGKRAIWRVFLAYRLDDEVYIFKGEVKGSIVASQGSKGFGFDPVFLPEGAFKTLAEEKPDCFNARALAVDAFVQKIPYKIEKAIYEWDGPWQEN